MERLLEPNDGQSVADNLLRTEPVFVRKPIKEHHESIPNLAESILGSLNVYKYGLVKLESTAAWFTSFSACGRKLL